MPLGNWSVEWLNLNTQRAYPLADWADGVDTSGTFTLPTDFLVELDLPVAAAISVDPARFYVLNLGVYANGALIVIGYAAESGPVPVATAQLQQGDDYTVYSVLGIGPFADTYGTITVGTWASLAMQPGGFYVFDLNATQIDADCIRPQLRSVSSITLVNGTDQSPPLTGDLELIAGNNISLGLTLVDGQNPQIVINAISGAGLTADCSCVGQAADLPCVTRINGVAAAADGSFTLVGDTCIQVSSVTSGLSLSDTCATPCCGCAELETITQTLSQLAAQQSTLSAFLNQLNAATNEMSMVVLGSKLGDQGCTTC